jgi:DNA-binding response OmpR family regulator
LRNRWKKVFLEVERMPRILVVDDEKVLVKGIKFNLENEGYQVETGYDGEEAVELARTGRFDLMILDLMMPKIDGLQACMKIREFSNVPVIMLTARGEDADKIMGFECGADDYITKPFNILELKARVRALLRRAGQTAQQGKAASRLSQGAITIDTDERAAWKNGEPVELTAKEFDLMELFLRNPGRVYSRENLLNMVWGYDYMGELRTVDVHVRRLREKLEPDPARPVYILTKWGVGYYFSNLDR